MSSIIKIIYLLPVFILLLALVVGVVWGVTWLFKKADVNLGKGLGSFFSFIWRFVKGVFMLAIFLIPALSISVYHLSTPHVVPAPAPSTEFCHTIEIRDGALMLEESDSFCRVFEKSTIALKFGYTKDIYSVEGIPDKRYWVVFEWHVGQPYGEVKLTPLSGGEYLPYGKFRCVNYTPNSYEGLRLQYWKDGDMTKLAREVILKPNSNKIIGVPEIDQAPWEIR